MAIVVEHDKRKHEILQKSLDVFVDEGYEDTTFQKIAARCGITRTTLYIYFDNKHEIFLGSIKELLNGLENDLLKIIENPELNNETKLRNILMKIIDYCEINKKLFCVLLDYLQQIKKTGANVDEKVRRRIIHLRHLLSTVLISGINAKEFKKESVKNINELFYGLFESAIFRLVVLGRTDISDSRDSLNQAVNGLLAE
jgi:AcrR family transcriptional regulator